MKKLLKYLFWLGLSWMLIHLGYTVTDGLSDKGETADAALILGNKVNEDGSLSVRLQKRLECGLELYRQQRVRTIIVSGGLGKEGHYEGSRMKQYLVQQGVPDSLIVTDNRGDHTLKSVLNTLRLKDSLHLSSLIVVSQYYHITRTKMLFRKQGFRQVSGASPAYFEWRDLYSLLREFFAFYSEAL